MSVNLVQLAKHTIGGPLLGQLASMLGINEKQGQAGIDAALPAIFERLMKKAATPAGATDIFQHVENQDPSSLDTLGAALEGSDLQDRMAKGRTLVRWLCGNQLDSLVNRISKTMGADSVVVSQLLGFLVPVVMSLLKRQQEQQQLDAASLVSLLSEQEPYLGGGLEETDTDRAATTSPPISTVDVDGPAQGAGSAIGKLLPLIGLLALALLAWMFIKGGAATLPVPNNSDLATEETGVEIELPAGPAEPTDESQDSPLEQTTTAVENKSN